MALINTSSSNYKPYLGYFNESTLSDCLIVQETPIHQTFKCHKLIIAAHSKFFQNFFAQALQNNYDSSMVPFPVYIRPSVASNDNVVGAILRYFYGAQDISELLQYGLSPKNSFEFLSVFDSLQCERGRTQVLDFIQSSVLNSDNCLLYLLDSIRLEENSLIEMAKNLTIMNFDKLMNNKTNYEIFLNLPLEVVISILESDDLFVEKEDVLVDLVADYINARESLSMLNDEEEFHFLNDVKAESERFNISGQDNIENESQKKLITHRLSDKEKKTLIKTVRLPFLAHETLMRAAELDIFSRFNDIFLESLSAKLNYYEGNTLGKYSINMEPRKKYLKTSKYLKQSNASLDVSPRFTPIKNPRPVEQKNLQENSDIYSTVQKNNTSQRIQNPTPSTKWKQNEPLNKMSNVFGATNPMLNSVHSVQSTDDFNANSVLSSMKLEPQKGLGQNNSITNIKSNQIGQMRPFGAPRADISFSNQTIVEDTTILKAFRYQFNFDENGVFFYLGTQGKKSSWQNPHKINQVKCFFSSLGKGNPEDFVGRSCVLCATLDEPGSFMGVDLGVNRWLIPNCYTLRNRNSSIDPLINWVLEGSINGKEWFWLDKRIHYDETKPNSSVNAELIATLKQKSAASTWGIHENQIKKIQSHIEDSYPERFKGFRYFKIVQIGKNGDGNYTLALSGIELYGMPAGDNWIFN